MYSREIFKQKLFLRESSRSKPHLTKSLIIKSPSSVKPETVGGSVLRVHQRRVSVLVEAAVRVRRSGSPSRFPAQVEGLERPPGRDDGADLGVTGVVARGQGAGQQQHSRDCTRKHLVQNDELRTMKSGTDGQAAVSGTCDTRQLSLLLGSEGDLQVWRAMVDTG